MSVVADREIRDRLKATQEALRAARDERAAKAKERDEAKEAFAGVEPNEQKITEMPEFHAAEQAVASLGQVDDQIADLSVQEQALLKLVGDAQGPSPVNNDGGSISDMRIGGWNGHRLIDPDDGPYKQAVRNGLFSSSSRFGSIQLGQIASREEAVRFFSELPSASGVPVDSPATAGLIQPDQRGLQAPLLRPLRLLDLFPTGTTDSNSIEYVQVVSVPGSANVVAEGSVKPQSGLDLEDATAPVRTIAGWIKVNRQAMDDAAGLSSLINTLLPYDVRRKIEYQILRGDGNGQNLSGILDQTGIGAPTFVSGDNIADAILRAMTVVVLADAEPNFAALHPLDWQDLLLMREDNAARTGMYLYGGPASMAAATIWGLSITPTVAINQGEPLVGDSMGATLLVREGVNVKTSDSDQDDFVRNRVTVLAEARVAFPVWRPASFAVAATS